MADYTYEQLKSETVAQLREIAKGLNDPSLEGHSTWHKEQLLPALCKVLKIPTHHIAHGENKARLKLLIRKLQHKRDEVVSDKAKSAEIRVHIHGLKRRLRKMAEVGV